MRPELERYLDDVLRAAGLAPADERAVRDELTDHLEHLEPSLAALSDEEVRRRMDEDFGNPDELGREIVAARGRFKNWVRRRWKSHAIAVVVALVVALGLRWQVAAAYRMQTGTMDPAVPRGAWMLVDKWSEVTDGDLVVADDRGRATVARVTRLDGDDVHLQRFVPDRTRKWPRIVPRDALIGRVWLVTR